MPEKRFKRQRESLRVQVLKRNMHKFCKSKGPVAYYQLLQLYEKKRKSRKSMTAVERARIRLAAITAVEAISDESDESVVEEPINVAGPEAGPHFRRSSFFGFRFLITLFKKLWIF